MNTALRHLPNCITALRIFGTISLLFTEPLSLWFYIVYCVAAATDLLDGFIARKFKLTSDLGAKLDSAADLVFYAVMIILILPILIEKLPVEIWYGVGLILFLRAIIYLYAAIRFHRFASTHSIINKITSACVFAIPFLLILPGRDITFWTITAFGILGSLQEMVRIFQFKK